MRSKYMLLVLLALIVSYLSALSISNETLNRVAASWWSYVSQNKPALEISKIDSLVVNGESLLYILHNRQEGFLILANESGSQPILAYGLTGTFDYPCSSQEVGEWLNMMSLEIQSIRRGEFKYPGAEAQWSAILAGDYGFWPTDRSVPPLLQTTWNQGYPYNRLCPPDSEGPGGFVWAGCTATAMAQVMRYWSWPLQGSGSNSYYHQVYGTQSANFEQTNYDWDNMPPVCDTNNPDIPLLIYHCGVAVNMNYSLNGSAANYLTNDALTSFFGYGAYQQALRSDYNDANWINLMKSELDQRRPILYSGRTSDTGHAFVLDGYSTNNYFHINWGWGGNSNGFFTLGSFLSYNQNNRAIIGLQPSIQHLPPQNVTVNNYGVLVKIQWSAPISGSCTGYKVYRNGELIYTISSPSTNICSIENSIIGASTYQVAATYTNGQSLPVLAGTITLNDINDDLFWNIPIQEDLGWDFGGDWTLDWYHPMVVSTAAVGSIDDRLLSPSIQCPANAGNLLTKMHYRDHPAYNDGITLEIAVICNNVATVLWTIYTSQDWGLFNGSLLELPISQFAGQSIAVQYRVYGNPSTLAGQWFIHDVGLSIKHPLDIAITDISLPDFTDNTATCIASVVVKNKGTQPTGSFTITLYRQGLQQLATMQGPPLSVGGSTTIQIPATNMGSGAVFVYALISYDAESFMGNNSMGYTTYIAPNSTLQKQIGQKSVLHHHPPIYGYATSMYQVLYHSSELQFQGSVQTLVLKSRFLDPAIRNWAVYMSNTNATTLSAIQPVNQSHIVYQGLVSVLPGENPLVLNLNTPFNYTGGNILLTFYSPESSDDVNSIWSKFWTYSVPANRARYLGGNSGDLINLSSPGPGSVSQNSPFINFVISGTLLSTVTGTVVCEGATGLAIPGATILFTGPTTHIVNTNDSGFFSTSGLHFGSNYNYSIQKQGYQQLTGIVNINSTMVNLGNLILQDIIDSPYNVNGCVMQNNSFCQVSWLFGATMISRNREKRVSGRDSTRVHTGFKIYRLLEGAEDDPTEWTELSSVGSSVRTYNDMSWNTLPAGAYKYAVTAWYNYSSVSSTAISEAILRYTDGIVVGLVRDYDGNPVVGAQVLVNQQAGYGPYSCQSDTLGFYQINGVHYGSDYSVVCSHPLYNNETAAFSLNANQVLELNFQLSDRIDTPLNLEVSIQDSTYSAILNWQTGTSRQREMFEVSEEGQTKVLHGYSVWRTSVANVVNESLWICLGETVVSSFTDSLWKHLPNDSYIYAVKSIYSSGQSSACLSDPITHLYFGTLRGLVSDGGENPLPGAILSLSYSDLQYTTQSDSLGYYQIDNVLPGMYRMSVDFSGYQNIVIVQVAVLMHEITLLNVTMNEILYPPQGLTAIFDSESRSVHLTWSAPESDSSKSFIGYLLWRLIPGQEFSPDSWISLIAEPVADTSYIDTSIPNNQGGVYRYGVRAVYTYNNISSVCYSGIIEYSVDNSEDQAQTPGLFSLRAFPNPAKGLINIALDMYRDEYLTVGIYNLRGQRVMQFFETNLKTGPYSLVWDGVDSHGMQLGSGVYLIRATSHSGSKSIKILYYRN